VLDGAGALIGVLALDIADGRVQAVSSVVNPAKLRHLRQRRVWDDAAVPGGGDSHHD
jgi:hypothetical protein